MEGQSKIKLSPEQMATMSPKDYRELVREGKLEAEGNTSGCCIGYTQHTLVILPLDYALEFAVFCIRNPLACYVADVSDPGSPRSMILAPDADVRTDCYRYRVFKDGEVIDEPHDIVKYWRDDLVCFFMPCSFTFEGVLREKHVKWRTMGACTSNIPCAAAGRFKCDNMIVSPRLFPTSLDAIRAIQITSQLPVAQGYPVHIGDPAEIGVDLLHMDIGSPYPPDKPPQPQQPNEICMCWAAAGTPINAIKAAKPPLAIMTYPGRMFISDRRTEEFHSSFKS